MEDVHPHLDDDEWVGTKLLFENEVVRVWDFKLSPGESTKVHTHRRDWLFVNVTGDNHLRIDYPNRDEVDHRKNQDGDVFFFFIDKVVDNKKTHRATNTGTEPLRQILIEFMRGSKA
jgi:beta-alanine degradation protein BauB